MNPIWYLACIIIFQSRLLAEEFDFELRELLIKRKLTEFDLPDILNKLKKKAATCSAKNDDGPGPPCSLMNDLEGTYAEMQILKKKRERTASKYFSVWKIVK